MPGKSHFNDILQPAVAEVKVAAATTMFFDVALVVIIAVDYGWAFLLAGKKARRMGSLKAFPRE